MPGRPLLEVLEGGDLSCIDARSLSQAFLLSLLTTCSDTSGASLVLTEAGKVVMLPSAATLGAPYERVDQARYGEVTMVRLQSALFASGQVMDTPVHTDVLRGLLLHRSIETVLLTWLGDLEEYNGELGVPGC